jgi:hypothetical protein
MNATATPSPYERYSVAARATFLGREIGRCKTCKRVTVRGSMFWSGSRVKCECGAIVKLSGMWAKESKTECGPRCTSAIGPSCDCKCNGRNHGQDHS